MTETRGRKPIVYTQIQKDRMIESGKRIESLIKKSKVSQRKIAKELHVDPKMIRRYRDGKQMIPEQQAIILADILKVTVEYILCQSNHPDPDLETYNAEQDERRHYIMNKTLDFSQIIDAGTERFFMDFGFNYYHNWPKNINFENADSADDIDRSMGTHFLYSRSTGKQFKFTSESFKKLTEALMEAIKIQG